MVITDALNEFLAAWLCRLERDYFSQPLDRVDGMGIQLAQGLAGSRAERIDTPTHQKRTQRHQAQERYQRHRHWPAHRHQNGEHRAGHKHGDGGGRYCMGEEVLNQFCIVSHHGHQVAGPATQEIRGRQPVELVEQVDAHFREQTEGEVVSQP